MKSEAKSAATGGLDGTLHDFKKSVVTTPQTTFPEEVYTALMQQYVVTAPEVKKINGELVKAVDDYVVDILEDNAQIIPVGDKTYTISYNFGKLLGLATVTSPDGKSYTVSWKNDAAQDSYVELLGNIKDYGNNFAVTFWTALTSDVASNFIDDVFNVIAYSAEKPVSATINYLKLTKAIDAGSADNLSAGIEALTKFLGETLFPKIFPNSNKTITKAQIQYENLLRRKSDFLKDIGDDKAVASLSSYKKFVTAFNSLETTIGQSQTSFSAILDEYSGYEFSDVANAEIDENRALINGNDDANVIIANGYSVTLNGNGGDDVIIVEGKNSSVNGGVGKDTIIINSSDVTVDGGVNFDSLPVPDIIRIESEAKDIVVKNFETTDTLDLSIYNADELSAGKYQTNSITIYSRKTYDTILILEEVTNRSSNNILCKTANGESAAVSLDWLLENTPPIVNPYDSVKSDDSIKPDDTETNNTTINGKTGGDTISNDRDGMTINLAAGNNSVNNSGKSVTINGGTDKDTVTNSGDNVVIYGNTGDDSIENNFGSWLKIDGGAYNDLIENLHGDFLSIDGGVGDDTIAGFEATDTLSISGGSYTTQTSGNDVIVKVGDGSITLKDAKYRSRLNIKGTLDTTTGNSSTSTTRKNSSTSTTTDGSSTSTTRKNSSTSTSTSGSSSTKNNNSSTSTASTQNIYTSGDKTISNYSGQAVTLGAFTGANFNGNNFVVNSPTGALIIENVTDKIVDLRDGTDNAFIKAYTPSTAGVIDLRGLAGYEIINGASAGSNVIFAGDGGSQLWGGSGLDADALVGGNGSDIFVGGRFQGSDNIFNASSADTVNLTDANLSDIVATVGGDGNISIGFNTNSVINIQSTELLSAAINFADGSSLRFNHATKAWQSA